jgi:hypothetical protein
MSFTFDTLTKPTGLTGSLASGGDLEPNTTYHYKVLSLAQYDRTYYTDVIYGTVFSEPSETFSITTDSTNKTVNLSWDSTDAVRYLLIRIKDGESFDSQTQMWIADSSTYPMEIQATSFTDDNSDYHIAYPYYEHGLPALIVDEGTTETMQDMLEWATANGYSNYLSAEVDTIYGRPTIYKMTGHLEIRGTLQFGTRECPETRGTTLFLNGGWCLRENGFWDVGELSNNVQYGQYGVQIIRTGKYTVEYMEGELSWKNVLYDDIGLADRVYIGGINTSHLIVRTSLSTPVIYFDRCLFRYIQLDAYDNMEGLIQDSIFFGIQMSAPGVFVKNCVAYGYRALYNYYATEDIVVYGITGIGTADEMLFHKNGTPITIYSVDCKWNNDPIKGQSISNPENLTIYDCKTFLCKVQDEDGNAIEGVTATITNADDDEITMTSDSDGEFYLAKGISTSGLNLDTLYDTSLNLEENELKNKIITVQFGSNPTKYVRKIKSNTATSITVYYGFPSTPTGVTYSVPEYIKFVKYTSDGSGSGSYNYQTTNYNPFKFEFTKNGYKTEEINGFNINDSINWVITMLHPEVPAYENISVSYDEDSLTNSITNEALSTTITEDSLNIEIEED